MKKILLIIFAAVLHFYGLAQNMPGMKMPMSEKSKKTSAVKKKNTLPPKKAANNNSVKKQTSKPYAKDSDKMNMDGMENMKGMENMDKMKNMDNMKNMDTMKNMNNMKGMDNMLGMNMSNSANQPAAAKAPVLNAKRTEYDFYVNDTTVNYTGKSRHAIAINGQIPGPTLELTEGDTAVIRVHNLMKVTTSIHWHGILIPNQYDGVPGLTTFPIEAGKTLTVVFPVRQNGTYWYHSHTMTQEQIGLTGSIVIHKRDEPKIKEEVLVLNDWTDTKPAEVWRLLKRKTDWYSIQKNSVQSYGEALAAGHLGDKIMQEWMRMPAMDVSDVKYNLFFTNGTPKFNLLNYKAGDRVKLRIINASSSSYFWLQFAGGKMQVISADGQDVKPVDVDKFLIATAETYDVIIQIPASNKYELRATAQDISGYTSAFFGSGNTVAAPNISKINYFTIMGQMNKMMMGMKGMNMGSAKETNVEITGNKKSKMPMDGMNMNDMDMTNRKMDMGTKKNSMKMNGMGQMDMKGMNMNDKKDGMKGMDMGGMKMDKMTMYGFEVPPGNGNDKVLSYKMLQAQNNSNVPVPTGKPDRVITLMATGNMFRYVWSFNNKVLTDADKILIKKGENVRVIFKNTTMMEHPLHLHGHFFRFRNGRPESEAPLKHTFNLLPMATDTIDFAASEEKDWFFHCHTLYHMLSGMARVFHYDNTLPEVQAKNPADYRTFLKEHGRHTFLWGSTSIQSQGNFGNATLAGTKWEANEEWNLNWKGSYESETMLRRFIDKKQYLALFVGADNRFSPSKLGKDGTLQQSKRSNVGTLGLTYFLPLLITAEGRVDHKGNLRFQLSRQDMEITKRTRFSFAWNTDKEYTLGLKYVLAKNFALSGNYDSDYGWGAGLALVY